MTLRERALIAALSVALVALSVAVIVPSLAPAGEVASPSATPVRAYVEGVLGHATNGSPFGARSSADRDLVALLFRGLVRLGPDQSIVPDLAESWEVDDTGSTWTFHLRPDLVWQDGQPITADDVLFTVKALSDPDYTGPGAESWREVTATEVDPLTISLKLATPLGGFLYAATQPIAPAHLLSFVPAAQLATDPFGRRPVGSGAFRLVSLESSRAILQAWSPGDVTSPAPSSSAASPSPTTDSLATLRPTAPAAEPAPYLTGIEFHFFDHVDDLRAAWNRGELDGASGLAPTDAVALAGTVGARLMRYPGSTLLAGVLNLRAGKAPFVDANVRRGLLAAIDRDSILSGVLAGLGTLSDGLIPPSSPLYDAASASPVAFDPAAARTALTDAGWTLSGNQWIAKGASEPLTIELLSPEEAANPVAFAVAETIARNWQAIGLNTTQVAQPPSQQLADRLRTGDYTAAMLPLVVGLDPDLYPLLASSQTRTGGSNVSGIQDPALDKLLAAARAPGSDDDRKTAYAALQARLAATLYILPIAFRDDYVVLRDTIQGPVARPVGTSGDRFWDVLTWRLAGGL